MSAAAWPSAALWVDQRGTGPIGLQLPFYSDEGRWVACFPVPAPVAEHRTGQPRPEHQGYPGQLHGGIISHCWTSQPGLLSTLAFSLCERA